MAGVWVAASAGDLIGNDISLASPRRCSAHIEAAHASGRDKGRFLPPAPHIYQLQDVNMQNLQQEVKLFTGAILLD